MTDEAHGIADTIATEVEKEIEVKTALADVRKRVTSWEKHNDEKKRTVWLQSNEVESVHEQAYGFNLVSSDPRALAFTVQMAVVQITEAMKKLLAEQLAGLPWFIKRKTLRTERSKDGKLFCDITWQWGPAWWSERCEWHPKDDAVAVQLAKVLPWQPDIGDGMAKDPLDAVRKQYETFVLYKLNRQSCLDEWTKWLGQRLDRKRQLDQIRLSMPEALCFERDDDLEAFLSERAASMRFVFTSKFGN